MKFLVLTFGTRGDVQPFVALSRGLRARGHDVVLAAPGRFAGLAAEHGVDLVVVDDGPLASMDGAAGAAVAGGWREKVALARAMPASFERVLADCAAVAAGPGAGADAVVHNGQIIGAPHVAEWLGVPAVLALTVPMYVPTGEFPWPGVDLPARLPGPVNRATYLGMRGPEVMFGRTVDRWRQRSLRLPRRRRRHDPLRRPDGGRALVLNAVSRHVVAPPADWPPSVTTTGCWFLPAAGELTDEVAAFLAAGPPPVFVGFGSMAGADPAATTRTVLAAVAAAGVRAILATGWGGLDPVGRPDGVLAVDQVAHDLVLPHVAAVVHHGGAGTTAAAAAAGVPQIVCPFVADQPFWGRQVQALGIGPVPLHQHRLDVRELAGAVRRVVEDDAMRRSARALGVRIAGEDGVGAAVAELERIARATVR